MSIFVSVKAGSADTLRRGALREESRATMHADPYSGRCYFRSILSIEEGRRTARAARRGTAANRARLRNRALFLAAATETRRGFPLDFSISLSLSFSRRIARVQSVPESPDALSALANFFRSRLGTVFTSIKISRSSL